MNFQRLSSWLETMVSELEEKHKFYINFKDHLLIQVDTVKTCPRFPFLTGQLCGKLSQKDPTFQVAELLQFIQMQIEIKANSQSLCSVTFFWMLLGLLSGLK